MTIVQIAITILYSSTELTEHNKRPGQRSRVNRVATQKDFAMLVKGQFAIVYQDPITQSKPEGVAKIIQAIGEGRSLFRYQVQFVGDASRTTYERTIFDSQQISEITP